MEVNLLEQVRNFEQLDEGSFGTRTGEGPSYECLEELRRKRE